MKGKRIYRVIKETADYRAMDEFTNRAAALRWAKTWAACGNWPLVYVLEQGCFDAWNTGKELARYGEVSA